MTDELVDEARRLIRDHEAFRMELQTLLNRYSKENGSNTPDFVLANYLCDCLRSWDLACSQREHWYGVHHRPGQETTP